MREHRGYLYLGGIVEQPHRPLQARRAPIRISCNTTSAGGNSRDRRAQGFRRPLPRPRRGDHHGAAVRRRAEAQPAAGERAEIVAGVRRARGSRDRRRMLYLADGARLLRARRRRPRRELRALRPRRSRRSARLPGRRPRGRARRQRGAHLSRRRSGAIRAPSFTDPGFSAVNALAPAADGSLLATDGSQTRGVDDWTHDLMELGRSGRVCSARSARPVRHASSPAGSAMPSALARPATTSWSARAGAIGWSPIARERRDARVVLDHLPVYPSRLSPAAGRRLLAHRLHRAHPARRVRACASPPIAGA